MCQTSDTLFPKFFLGRMSVFEGGPLRPRTPLLRTAISKTIIDIDATSIDTLAT